MKKYLLIFFVSLCGITNAQLIVSNSAPYNSFSYLVNNVLLGGGVTITNITYSGTSDAIGFFNGMNSNIGIDSGIVITNGNIINAIGPNISSSIGTDNGTTTNDIDMITIDPNEIFDVAILQFDFVPSTDTVVFDYAFGSEEYPEFVNSVFNDAFGFFLSGVTVSLPSKNIALIPSTTTPISINNVNNGTGNSNPCPYMPTSGPCANCAYYIDNCTGTTIQYDGFTTVLTAIAGGLIPGQTYHIKMAIADAGDHVYDSGVFLKGCSFGSATKGFCTATNTSENDIQKKISIFPNPFSTQTVLQTDKFLKNATLAVFNLYGQQVKQIKNISGQTVTFYRDNLASGLYFVRLTQDSKVIAVDKLVITDK